MRIQEIEQLFKDIFQENTGVVHSMDSVYEASPDGTHYRLVITLHNLMIQETVVIHTKFVFRTDLDKINLHTNYFHYLYDINCHYRKVDFENIIKLREELESIIETSDFGKDLTTLSDFIQAPATFLNFYLRKSKITEYSIFDVKYDPKFKTLPCENMSFDFDININNNYFFEVSIRKIESEEQELPEKYKFMFKFMDEMIFKETDTLANVQSIIGSNIAKILDERLRR